MSRTLLGCSLFLIVVRAGFTARAARPVVKYNPREGGVRLVEKSEVPGNVPSRFSVKAEGETEVLRAYATVAGVLFQATAKPHESVATQPIRLSYRLNGKADAVLSVKIGKRTVVSESPAWVWAVAAKFANHKATAAVTMLDKPPSPAADRFERRWHANSRVRRRLVWARYHPAVDDTVMGFFLLAADALVGDPQSMRNLALGLPALPGENGSARTIDRASSRSAARSLDAFIELKAKSGDTAMLNDLDSKFVFNIAAGRLRLTGAPTYRFARKDRGGTYRDVKSLSTLFRRNRRLLRRANPRLDATIIDFSRHVAFFNHVKRSHPSKFRAFVASLPPVMNRLPTMKTPIAVPLPLRVKRQAVEVRGVVMIEPPKTEAGQRTLQLPQRVVDAPHDRRRVAMSDGHAKSHLVFPALKGGIIRRTNFGRRTWKSLLKKLGLLHRGFHHMRHTAITHMLRKGIKLEDVAAIAGHSRPSFLLDTYRHWIPTDGIDAAEKMNEIAAS